MLVDFYRVVSPALIARFKGQLVGYSLLWWSLINTIINLHLLCAEREENVKADIFTAYRALLNMTRAKPLPSQQRQATGEGEAMEVSDR